VTATRSASGARSPAPKTVEAATKACIVVPAGKPRRNAAAEQGAEPRTIMDALDAWLAKVSPDWRAVFEPNSNVPWEAGHILWLKARIEPFVHEAAALREALHGKGFFERTHDIEQHRPSAGAIAMLTVVSEEFYAVGAAKNAAHVRHKRDRENKANALARYKSQVPAFRNKEIAATCISKELGLNRDTVRGWLKGVRRQEQP
jgi:hypothetical protein